jgi:hypothetical protein
MPSIVKDEDSEEVVYARCALNEARYIYGLLRRNADEAREKADKWKQDEMDCEKKRNEAVSMLRGGDEYTGDEARSELQSLMIKWKRTKNKANKYMLEAEEAETMAECGFYKLLRAHERMREL